MGAISVSIEGRGQTMQEAFISLQKQAEEEYGYDHYNGKINNCELTGDWTHKYNKRNLDKLYDEAINKLHKPCVIGICTKEPKKNKNKVKSVVNRTPQKGTRKWVTKYVGTDWDGMPVCEANTLTECIKKARAHTEKTQQRVYIDIEKRLETGNKRCATVEYKKSKSEELGTYIFFGWAAD